MVQDFEAGKALKTIRNRRGKEEQRKIKSVDDLENQMGLIYMKRERRQRFHWEME